MKFIELARKRCSIRSYSPEPVEQDKLQYILESARLAPSAVNFQPWFLLVLDGEEERRKAQECYTREWFRPAPVYIAVCGDHRQSWKRGFDGKDHLDIDMGIVIEHICLAAAEQELGTCIICHFDAPLFSRLFKLPEGVEPVTLIPIGYPADPDLFSRTAKKRKELQEITQMNQ